MKKLTTLLVAILFTGILIAQAETGSYGKVEFIEEDGNTIVLAGGNVVVYEGQDTTKIKIGKKGVTIVEDEEGSPSVTWEDLEEIDEPELENDNDDVNISKKRKKKAGFDPHWSGIEIGLNGFVNDDYSMNVAPNYMDLNTGKSWNFNYNFMEHGIKLGTPYLGLVTGLGVEVSNYHFDNGNIITETGGNIVEHLAPVTSTDKSKLQTTFLTAPLLLEFQVPAGKKDKFFISAGVVGGVKLSSKTKLVYYDNGEKYKEKAKDDFNISALRYGLTGRIGFRSLKLFANYYPLALFEEGSGPIDNLGNLGDNLYPFSVGIHFLNF